MDPRTTISGRAADRRDRAARSRRRPPITVRRPAFYLGAAVAGALMVDVLVGVDPAAQAEAGTAESVSVARQLGLSAQPGPAAVTTDDLQPLEQLAASRSTRDAAQSQAGQAQAAADQAVLDQQQAAARAAAEAAAAAAAQEQKQVEEAAAAPAAGAPPAAAPTAAAVAADAVARITNSAGSVKPQVQTAANAVVSNVPGADGITLGGTRASATDPHGHPSGLALDYMVMSNATLGDAIARYHIDHWDELGVEYIIWEQRMLSSPGGSWQMMADRGSATENHMDHVHVNYR
ncbi:MAG TPA: hypothetical protein VIG96_11410 [Blastococcus sp.]